MNNFKVGDKVSTVDSCYLDTGKVIAIYSDPEYCIVELFNGKFEKFHYTNLDLVSNYEEEFQKIKNNLEKANSLIKESLEISDEMERNVSYIIKKYDINVSDIKTLISALAYYNGWSYSSLSC